MASKTMSTLILRSPYRSGRPSSPQSIRRLFSSSSSAQYDRRVNQKPWVKKKQERVALQDTDDSQKPDLTALKHKTLSRYNNAMNLQPGSSNLPPSEYFLNLIGLMASFDKTWQLQFETYKLFVKVVADFKIEPTASLVQQLLPIFASRDFQLPGNALRVVLDVIITGCPPEIQDLMLKDFFKICLVSKNPEFAGKLWRHLVEKTSPSQLHSRITDDIWLTYMKTLENNKEVLQSWTDIKSSRDMTNLPEIIIEFLCRAAARDKNIEALNDLKASLPVNVVIYKHILRHALKNLQDFDLAEQTIREMQHHNMDIQFEQRMLFDFAALHNKARALAMWKQFLETHQGLAAVNPHIACTALTVLTDSEPDTCNTIMSNFLGPWKDKLTSSMMHRLFQYLYSAPMTPDNIKHLTALVDHTLDVLVINQAITWSRDRKMHHALLSYWICMPYTKPDSPRITLSWVKTLDQALRIGLYSQNPVAIKQLVRLICDLALQYGVVKQEDVLGFLKTSGIKPDGRVTLSSQGCVSLINFWIRTVFLRFLDAFQKSPEGPGPLNPALALSFAHWQRAGFLETGPVVELPQNEF
eukprot:TRINITY_DN15643_c0_g1_i1.p1 TRINITY_DN15643_c0_g1~~TRINITY_DN15643_c0_g1_i1.p1  ORF type:complete len:583 (-),score=79.99 TRINITY_DN15643_c0_g1_i1:2-1750(-)